MRQVNARSGLDAAALGIAGAVTPTQDALLADLEAHLRAGQGFTVATVNLDHLVKLRRDPAFRAAYERHTYIVADGNPVVWLRRLAGRPVGLVPGSDLVEPLAALAARVGVPMALLGATKETLDLAAEKLVSANPTLEIVAKISPGFAFDPTGAEADACLAELKASGARFCLIALGAPKQEILAVRGHELLPECGFASIGAGLDFIAGTQRRAPLWMRRLALEWVWRLAGDPRRLAKRYGDCALVMPGMAILALRYRWSSKAEAT